MRKRKGYRHIVTAVHETAWAILPSKLDEIMELIDLRASGRRFTGSEIAARIGDRNAPALVEQNAGGQIAVLNLFGTIFHRADAFTEFSGGTSAERFGRAFDEAVADESVSSILINIDSPGGSVPGVQEVADKIFEARGTKPIVSLINPMAASAAYWIGAQAEELVSIPSATTIGSIGVLTVHTDLSAANEAAGIKRTYIQSVPKKAQFNRDEPLSAEDEAEAKDRVRQIHRTFAAHVARGRGIDVETVNSDFGGGRTFLAEDALERGMIDRIATFEEVLADLGAQTAPPETETGRFAPAFASMAPCSESDPRFQPIAELIG